MEKFKNKFKTIIEAENLTGNQKFDCDETDSYKMLTTKSLGPTTEAVTPEFKNRYIKVMLPRPNMTDICQGMNQCI